MPKEGHSNIREGKADLFTDQKSIHGKPAEQEFFFTNRSLTSAFSKRSHFPWQAFYCSQANYSWAGRQRTLTGGASPVAEVRRAILERKSGTYQQSSTFIEKVDDFYSVVFGKVVARLKFDTGEHELQLENCELLERSCSYYRARWHIGPHSQLRSVEGQDYFGVSYFSIIQYSFLQTLSICLNLTFHESRWTWFGRYSLLVKFCIVGVDALIIIHTHKIHSIVKENFLYSKVPKLM